MITYLDVESTYIKEGDRNDPTPYRPTNRLVSVGYAQDGEVSYDFFHHRHLTISPEQLHERKARIQATLDTTTLLVCHNAKFDYGWLLASGFKYEGAVYCTQIGEYVLARGIKLPFSLAASCERRGTPHQKSKAMDAYFSDGVPVDEMPVSELEAYGRQDVLALRDLYASQQVEYDNSPGLKPTVLMMNEFLLVVLDMERAGIKIDMQAVAEIKEEFSKEKAALDAKLYDLVHEAMGDKPYNLDSPEQLSQVLYSRKVIDKHIWKDLFNLGSELRGSVKKKKYATKMTNAEFVKHVRANTTVIRKTRAEQCSRCRGTRYCPQVLDSGKETRRNIRCPACEATGVLYKPLDRVGGFKFNPRSSADTAVGGFTTDGDTLEALLPGAKSADAREFVVSASRANALETYLSTYVAALEVYTNEAGILRPRINQTVAATGRTSSSGPNFQNLPRVGTFPLRRAITSRWAAGSICECDYGKLEYVVAAFLAQCPVAIKDIRNKVDAHAITRDFLEANGQVFTTEGPKDRRQEAKPRTFQPLYGGRGNTDAERAYCKWFLKKHTGIAKWQDALQTEAINRKCITIPSGRVYAFPNATRTRWGGATGATQIKNYPVQGFATADIVPLGCILTWKEFRKRRLKSLLILTVHDSLVADVYPGEEDQVVECFKVGMLGVIEELKTRYNVEFNIPLDIEIKAGPNWLAMKDVGAFRHDGYRQTA